MIVLLALLSLPWFAGILAMIFGLRNAPLAEEDASGFRLVWQNNTPDARDVACVWTGDLDPMAQGALA